MRPDEFFKVLRLNYRSEAPLQNAFILELIFWAIVVLVSVALLHKPWFFQRIEDYGKRLSRRHGLTCATVILTCLALRVVVLPLVPIPEPEYHDEYSYLLQADTFASGRLTNPTPLGWEHFETFHVNMRPTYQSMYPPGNAIFLAAARVLHLPAWWAVWLTVGLMCGAITWMLQGWVPPQWAFLAGLFCVLRFSVPCYWMESYFGGAVAAIGGALLMGALPRLRRSWSPWLGLIVVVGLGLMANTRSYEGFVFSVPPTIAISWWFFADLKRGKTSVVALLPGLALFVLIVAAMGYYNWANTGSPTLAPYMLSQRDYHLTKPFIWQSAYPVPKYRHNIMRVFFAFHELPDYYSRLGQGWLWKMAKERFEAYYDFFVWPMLCPGLFAICFMLKKRKLRIVAITVLTLLIGLLVEQWPPEAHYAAPVLGAVILIVIYGLRLLRTWRPYGRPFGTAMARGAVLCFLAWSIVPWSQALIDPFRVLDQAHWKTYWMPSQLERARIQNQLLQTPGRHIVFVRFRSRDLAGIFWLYNDPDVANSKVIWAYDMGEASNLEFMQIYPNRTAWIVDKNDYMMPLLRYSPDKNPSSALMPGSSW